MASVRKELMPADESVAGERTASWRTWLARNLRLEEAHKFEIYQGIATPATMRDATYWAEILFSAGIATLGLILNSPAVIIGAMLISPLMNPIMAAGLALAAGDFILAMRALMNLASSSAAAVAFSTLLVTLLPFREMTAEIASRTHPNTLDLVIALFSGAVGALAVCKSVRGVVPTSLPGVAIAVALMPPLCVTGYGIGVFLTVDRPQGLAILAGGGLLFVTNLVAITFSSMLVFLLLHIDSVEVRQKIREWRSGGSEAPELEGRAGHFLPDPVKRIGSLPARFVLVATLLVIVFVPLKRSFDTLSAEIRERQRLNRTQRAVTELWEKRFATTRGGSARSYVDWLDVAERDHKLSVTVRAFISESITEEERNAYAESVADALGRPRDEIQIAVVEIPTSTYQVAKAKKDVDLPQLPVAESAGTRFQRAADEILTRVKECRLPPAAQVLDASLSVGDERPMATIAYLAPAPISEDAQALIAASLREQSDLPDLDVRLIQLPSRSEIRFDRQTTSIPQTGAAVLDAVATAVRSRASLSIVLEMIARDGLAGRRVDAVRQGLIARGVAETQITSTVSAGTNAQQVIILIERPAVSDPILRDAAGQVARGQ